MRVEKVAKTEKLFKEKLTNANNTKYAKMEDIKLDKCKITPISPGYDSYYYKTKTSKDKIILHYTIGHLRGDLATINKKDSHVSVPYLIARDGSIYELFNPEYWSYHVGRGAVGGNGNMSKSGIGIELSNYGPLTLSSDGKQLLTAYTGKRKDVYCDVSQKKYYTKVDPKYRGCKYFATHTPAQYKALKELIDYLCKRFDIPNRYFGHETDGSRFKTFANAAEAKKFKGICSHVNFRKTGKTDIGPAFDWDKIAERIIFKIDVGKDKMPKAKADKHLKEQIKKLSRVIDYDVKSGLVKPFPKTTGSTDDFKTANVDHEEIAEKLWDTVPLVQNRFKEEDTLKISDPPSKFAWIFNLLGALFGKKKKKK
jgi:N-acetyl-anhydromuramyl-L-alanine amidase AmpD